MILSPKQEADLETIRYFYTGPQDIQITDKDVEDFFAYSERGIKPRDFSLIEGHKMRGFHVLVEGKRWRGIHIHEMYEQGILDGSMPYFILLGGYDQTEYRKWWQFCKPRFVHKPIPRAVVDFMKKEMFKGADAEIIENCYQQILAESCPPTP